jgi:hypothetical protein
MSLDPDDPEPRPWFLLALAVVLVFIGLDNLDDRELAVEGFGLGAFCSALFFLPDLRELMSRWPWRD